MTRISRAILLSVIPLIILASSIAMAPNGPTINNEETRSLSALLPESTLVSIEFRNLRSRWNELQAIPGMRAFHERLLGAVGMHPDDIPHLAGDRAVVALVPTENNRSVMPVVLLRPDNLDEAELLVPGDLTVHRGDDVLWISFGATADRLRELAEADGPNLSWNPKGDELIHGRIDPKTMAAFLRGGVEGIDPPPLAIARSMYAGMLDNVQSIGFTRDIVPGAIIVDSRIELIPDLLPTELVQVFRTAPDSPPVLPSPLPRHVVMASSFRTEPAASLAWFNQIAGSDPRGPLRNFEFWMGEFEARTGHNLEQVLVDTLGERGWFFLLEGDQDHTLNAVGIFETRDEAVLDGTLSELFSWIGEQTRGKTLGLVSPRINGNSMIFRTPFGEFPGPAYELRDGRLMIGTSPEALAAGRKLLRTRNAWQPMLPAVPRTGQFANESVRISGQALARWVEMLESTEDHPGLHELLHNLDTISLDVWYAGDAIQISGQLQFQ